jgi:hypothetical protein
MRSVVDAQNILDAEVQAVTMPDKDWKVRATAEEEVVVVVGVVVLCACVCVVWCVRVCVCVCVCVCAACPVCMRSMVDAQNILDAEVQAVTMPDKDWKVKACVEEEVVVVCCCVLPAKGSE